MILIFAMLAPLLVLAGNDLPELPGGFVFEEYVSSFLTWIATVVFLTGLINRLPWLGFEDSKKRYLSWGAMASTAVLSFFMGWGIFDTTYLIAGVYLLAGGIGSHFGYHLIKEVLKDFGVPTK